MRKILLIVACVLSYCAVSQAQGGMWVPSLIEERVKDMQSKGLKISAGDIYATDKASYKDAVVLFGGGCTGEMVSSEGLMLTNHHCGFSVLQKHSSVEHDYLKDGFWAMNRDEELPNPGLTVKFLVRMDDVTDKVFAGTEGLSASEAESIKRSNIEKVIQETVGGTHYEADVKTLYYGNQYYIYVYEVFEDVRIVGAPPSSIGKFGGETDNWMWPRHTGDFMYFRVYAGKDNKPAPYSKDNVPYKPKKYFNISTGGIGEGDFTMVYGYPARTQQYLFSSGVDDVLSHSNPAKIKLRTMRLEEIQRARKSDPAIRIAYSYKEASIANAWKKWQGESLGLERLKTIAKKEAYEKSFEEWAYTKPEYKDVVSSLRAQYDSIHDYSLAWDYLREAIFAIELVQVMRIADKWIESPSEAIPQKLSDFYGDYYPEIDKKIAKKLLAEYMGKIPQRFIPDEVAEDIKTANGVDAYVDMLFQSSSFVSADRLASAIAQKQDLTKDPAVVFYFAFANMFNNAVRGKIIKYDANIEALQKTFVRGQKAFDADNKTGRVFFPDANHTLRVSYGSVSGYSPEDAVWYMPISTLEGIIAKDNPQEYEFNIPQKLRDIHASSDYGRWSVNGTVPVCFIANNHTSGGNSGSPVLNGKGELIGINFDRTWTGTMSDIEFDPEICRNISLDIRYVLFVTEKIGGAGYLIDEMNIVHSKAK
ncbi:S46 family peptidase [Dysgonomonas sp. 511]|uniref:S46 family peptidase n=1 Tax=Dysgonomonas sp. 511 TaxID=2302930 RepID=UPI0013D07D7C|nr:S46 family peptidase [Dysgonomonas sp. 511]NDV78100.1 S46 family peptidase [Dysgonomonas sp. 511]